MSGDAKVFIFLKCNIFLGQNAWEQLGLDKGCTKEEVNKAYRKLAILLHPDKTAVKGADEGFKLLGMARRAILNSFT